MVEFKRLLHNIDERVSRCGVFRLQKCAYFVYQEYRMVTEGIGVLKREVMVKEIEKKYDHPLAEIVQIASQYKSEILLEYDKYRINAKSIMGIIAFNPSKGMNVTIAADGKDEGEAVEALEKFFICQ